jgi:multimeric flavodoxin WrbA
MIESFPFVLGIVGSPRRQGNTAVLVDEVLQGAQEAGAQVEKVLLARLKIAPCTACDACQETGECVFRDDMAGLLDKMRRSQIWVLGTPVYWWGPSAQFKAFVDRWYSTVFLPADREIFRAKRVILAIPLGDSSVEAARHTVGMLTDALRYCQSNLIAVILAPGVNDPGQVRNHPQVLATARQAGRDALADVDSLASG